MMKSRHLSTTMLVLIMVLSNFGYPSTTRASESMQGGVPEALAQKLLDQMSPEERVGQLLLVTFTGSETDASSQIYDLITQYHVGGVILLSENENFTGESNTVADAYQLISSLQNAEWNYSKESIPSTSGSQIEYQYIPVFIGISQQGDGYPGDQILDGVTILPNLMSIGATWDPDLAERTGIVTGQELAAIGFNFYLGPSLDVLEYPGTSTGSALGASVFGGDPYWVGAMGEAYISGIHTGSDGRMAVIAGNFPGRGSADRPSGDEVATVRKTLESLNQIELAPFFTVTGKATSITSTVDGLLVSHIRYQGFQGNIRATTRPVSFDSQALSQILSLPDFSSWRSNGGILVSDDLGSDTVRRFYDSTGSSFSARIVARDAFLAGNDLLYLGNITSSDQMDSYNTVILIAEFFAQKYREDPAFAQRVDNSVLRILALKYRMYGEFNIEDVLPDTTELVELGQSTDIAFEVADKSATLISPDVSDLASVLPNPPEERDHIVFLTDVQYQQQCSACIPKPVIAVNALQNAVLRLYGPQGVGLVSPTRMTSYSFNDLLTLLQDDTGNTGLEYELGLADWVIISMLAVDPNQPEDILRRFLSERQDLLREKNVVVFAFDAPYYLDATDISKLTAYYGLYSKSEPFIEIAARILFQEITPSGALPVSVPGIGYDLLSATAPDPDQVINLSVEIPASTPPVFSTTPEATPTQAFRIGDTITITTGIIVDHNGHAVPDGTGVRFVMTQSGDNDIIQQVDGTTTKGIGEASFSIDRAGLLEVRATSEPAIVSVVLQIEITAEGMNVTALPPTSSIGELTPVPESTIENASDLSLVSTGRPGISGWLLMLLLIGVSGALIFWAVGKILSYAWGLRVTLCTILGGALAYTYLAAELPGAVTMLQKNGVWGILLVVITGILLGLAAGLVWWRTITAKGMQSS